MPIKICQIYDFTACPTVQTSKNQETNHQRIQSILQFCSRVSETVLYYLVLWIMGTDNALLFSLDFFFYKSWSEKTQIFTFVIVFGIKYGQTKTQISTFYSCIWDKRWSEKLRFLFFAIVFGTKAGQKKTLDF